MMEEGKSYENSLDDIFKRFKTFIQVQKEKI